MKPLPWGASRCCIATSTVGENFSGIVLSCSDDRHPRLDLALGQGARDEQLEGPLCRGAQQLAEDLHELRRQPAGNLHLGHTGPGEEGAKELIIVRRRHRSLSRRGRRWPRGGRGWSRGGSGRGRRRRRGLRRLLSGPRRRRNDHGLDLAPGLVVPGHEHALIGCRIRSRLRREKRAVELRDVITLRRARIRVAWLRSAHCD